MWNELAIRHKLSMVIGGALLLSLIISTLISNNAMRDMVMGRIQIQEVPATLSSIANAIEKEINIPLSISKAMSQNHFTNRWLNNGEPSEQVTDITNYLSVMQSENNAITSFIVSGTTNNYYTPQGISRQISPSNDKWFYNFINSNKTYSLDIDIDAKLKKAALFINYRTPDNKSITGIGMGVTQIVKLISNYKIGENGFVYVVDPNGVIKIHPDNTNTDKELNKYLGENLTLDLLDKKSVQVLETHSNKDAIIAAQFIPSLNWFIVAEIPTTELYGPINASSLKLVILNFIVAALLIAVGLWVAMGFAKPVAQAARMLNTISSGDADLTKTMPVLTGDEVGKLAKSFNNFISQLHVLISSVSRNSLRVNDSAIELSEASNSTKKNTENQQQSVDMVAAAINQMGATV